MTNIELFLDDPHWSAVSGYNLQYESAVENPVFNKMAWADVYGF